MTQYYDAEGIRRLMQDGLVVPESGTYAFWVWAKARANVRLDVEGQQLGPTHDRNALGLFSWEKAGEVTLRRGANARVRLSALTPFEGGRFSVGCIAVSSRPGFYPGRSFELARVHPDSPEPVDDGRLRCIRHGEMFNIFPNYPDKHAWLARARYLREHILVSSGLWPIPERTPPNPKVFERAEHDGYAIEKVYFESHPGLYVTGNLFRPVRQRGPFPGVLCPHGHWQNGRLQDSDDGSVPGRCINFARQGYVVFSYDMIGYNDSFQLEHGGGDRYQSLWGISRMGLQLWNSIRSVDFLCSLEEVDPDRIGCTGASGGGTQTYALMAVDERIKVAAPVCMVSSVFQGGCVCENAPNLRVDTFNTELAALMAPRPLLLVGVTQDWTRHTPDVEYPALRRIYQLFDADDKLAYAHFDAPHNYNKDSREAAYAWFGRWLLGTDDPKRVKEQPFVVPPKEEMLVFQNTPKPDNALDEEGLKDLLINSAKAQLAATQPRKRAEWEAARDTLYTAFSHTLGVHWPGPQEVHSVVTGRVQRPQFLAEPLVLGRTGKQDQVPALLYTPNDAPERGMAALVVHPEGKAGLVDHDQGEPAALVGALLGSGVRVLIIDVFLTGEFHSPLGKSQRDEDIQFFDTYNQTDLALRVQDILTALAFLDAHPHVSSVRLVALGRAGLWALLACGLAPRLERAAIDVDGFDMNDDDRWLDEAYVPGLRRAGGFHAAGALAAPTPLFLHHTRDLFDTGYIEGVYRALDADSALKIKREQAAESELVQWLAGR